MLLQSSAQGTRMHVQKFSDFLARAATRRQQLCDQASCDKHNFRIGLKAFLLQIGLDNGSIGVVPNDCRRVKQLGRKIDGVAWHAITDLAAKKLQSRTG